MKKLSLLLILASLSVCSYAQNTASQPKLIAMLGSIPPKINPDGKIGVTTVTRDMILANAVLTMPPPPCDIVSYTFSVLPKGKDFMGPFAVTGASLTANIKKTLKDMEDPQGKVFIENIKANCGGKEMTVQPILLNMVK